MNKFPNRILSFIKLMLLFILMSGITKSQPAKKGVKTMKFTLTSPAFHQGDRIPTQYTCEGEDLSPQLQWSSVPEGSRSFALSCLDPDAPPGTWVHWVVYDLPADTTELGKGVPKKKDTR